MTKITKQGGATWKRHAAPKSSVVTMADVPEPPLTGRSGISDALYAQIAALKPGSALKVEVETEQHGDYIRGKLRKKAKADKQFMSSSRSADGKTRYFWLEKL